MPAPAIVKTPIVLGCQIVPITSTNRTCRRARGKIHIRASRWPCGPRAPGSDMLDDDMTRRVRRNRLPKWPGRNFASRSRVSLLLLLSVTFAAGTRSVWDGVYTKEQSGRGQAVYREDCQKCHAENLLGGE